MESGMKQQSILLTSLLYESEIIDLSLLPRIYAMDDEDWIRFGAKLLNGGDAMNPCLQRRAISNITS
jgi:hypothetical protein